jgi:steroid 5-alpha reductase family enzyme
MRITNTKNRMQKEIQASDLIDLNIAIYQFVGETNKSYVFNKFKGNPSAKNRTTINKNTFNNKYFYDSKMQMWIYRTTTSVPNFDYE